jgi:N-acetylglucosaminyl-diphospho-decaprenol L-rhamnosyltransferase
MNISAIIVEYKDIETVRNAVRSIEANLSNYQYDIFVVSNSSYSLNVQDRLRIELPGINFIFNVENTGFAKACNQGIKESKSEHILLINPDASLLDESIKHALDLMKKNRRIAVVGPMIVNKEAIIQDSCRYFMTFRKLLWRTLRRFVTSQKEGIHEAGNIGNSQPVDWVSGACMLVQREAINQAGPLDERYFMYIEDMDWCRTFWKSGWEVWYQPRWRIEHNAGRGSTSGSKLRNKLMWVHILSYCKYCLKWWGQPMKKDIGFNLLKNWNCS